MNFYFVHVWVIYTHPWHHTQCLKPPCNWLYCMLGLFHPSWVVVGDLSSCHIPWKRHVCMYVCSYTFTTFCILYFHWKQMALRSPNNTFIWLCMIFGAFQIGYTPCCLKAILQTIWQTPDLLMNFTRLFLLISPKKYPEGIVFYM